MAFTWGQKRAPAFTWGQPRKASTTRDYMNGLAGGVMGQRFQPGPGFEDYRAAQGGISAYFEAPPEVQASNQGGPQLSDAPGAQMFAPPDYDPTMGDVGGRFANVRPRRRIRRGDR